jgi:hypothetical protein
MFGDAQNWGLEGRQREEIKRRQNAEFLAGLRQQIESQKRRKRRDRFEPTAVEPGRMRLRNQSDVADDLMPELAAVQRPLPPVGQLLPPLGQLQEHAAAPPPSGVWPTGTLPAGVMPQFAYPPPAHPPQEQLPVRFEQQPAVALGQQPPTGPPRPQSGGAKPPLREPGIGGADFEHRGRMDKLGANGGDNSHEVKRDVGLDEDFVAQISRDPRSEWVLKKIAKVEARLQAVVTRAENAEGTCQKLSEDYTLLRAQLDAATKLADEKLNQVRHATPHHATRRSPD